MKQGGSEKPMSLERDEFILRFREVQPKFSRFYARLLTQAKLTLPQYALLNLLLNRGTIPMTEASQSLYITKPAVTNLVDRLEKNKFLKRVPHAADRRVSLLRIEPKGEKLVRETQAQVLGFLLKALEEFNENERGTIRRFYAALSRSMDDALGHSQRTHKE